MKNIKSASNKMLNPIKNLFFCGKYLYLCSINSNIAPTNKGNWSFFYGSILTKDNTPSRLTSVAHLGGFLFYKSMEI